MRLHQNDSWRELDLELIPTPRFQNIQILPLGKSQVWPSSPLSKCSRLRPNMYSSFCFSPTPASIFLLRLEWPQSNRANSHDSRPQKRVPRSHLGHSYPSTQHGKGANCLDRPQDNRPLLPSSMSQQEKIQVIQMEFLTLKRPISLDPHTEAPGSFYIPCFTFHILWPW